MVEKEGFSGFVVAKKDFSAFQAGTGQALLRKVAACRVAVFKPPLATRAAPALRSVAIGIAIGVVIGFSKNFDCDCDPDSDFGRRP